MNFKALLKFSLVAGLFVLSAFVFVNTTLAARTCCTVDPATGGASGNCDGCRAEGIETKNYGDSCGGAANCEVCPSTNPKSNQCGTPTTTTKPATCNQYVYVLTNPTNMQVGQSKDFYADGTMTNGNFAGMTASLVNVPVGGTAVATVATTAAPVCYANGNCRQGFRLTARTNGTALLTVKTSAKLCPACAVSGSCSKTYTINVGDVTPLACYSGAGCTSNTGSFKVGSDITCKMATLTTTQLNGGTAGYYSECVPYKGTVAQAKIAKSSTTATFAPFKLALGVTDVKCSFRYCITGTDRVSKCSSWGTAI